MVCSVLLEWDALGWESAGIQLLKGSVDFLSLAPGCVMVLPPLCGL